MGKPAPYFVVTIGGQYADQGLIDRRIFGEVSSNTGIRIHGELSADLRWQIGAAGERPAQQQRRVADEVDDGFSGCGRVPNRHLLHVVSGGLVGAVAGGAGQQIAVESRALRIVHERRLFTVADQAPLCGWLPLAGEQRRQYGRWRRLVGRHRAADLGVRMRRESGGRLRCRPQRERRDDLYVRVGGQHLHHIERKAGAGGQLLPALDDWIFREETPPLRASGTLGKQGERDVRLCRGINVCGGQQACIRKRHSAFLDTRGQHHRLRVAEAGPMRKVRSDLGVRDRDQPVDQLGRQAYVGGKPAQNMVHRGILPGTSPNRSWISMPRCYR